MKKIGKERKERRKEQRKENREGEKEKTKRNKEKGEEKRVITNGHMGYKRDKCNRLFLRGEKNYKISSVPAYIKSEFLSHDHVYHLSSVRQNPRTAEMEFSKRA